MENNMANSQAMGMAMLGAFMIVFVLIGLVFYAYNAICQMITAKKLKVENAWLAWIPIGNMYLLAKMAKKPGWWTILFLIPFVNIVCMIIAYWKVSEFRGKEGWLSILLLVPVVNLVILGYLAFSK
jgi:hypothetical protein